MNPRETLHACPRDGFPMIELHGAATCSVEYADATVGGQKVVDARESNGYLYLYFENGSSLPLTCPCCGGRLHLRSLTFEQLSWMIAGRELEGFRHGEWVSKDEIPQRHPIFALQFSGNEDLSARTIQVHLESVRRITEPAIARNNKARLI